MFVGLVKDPGRDWRPPDDGAGPRRRRPHWRLFARTGIWVVVFGGLYALVPVADHLAGHVAAYLLILLTIGLGAWRMDRWLDHQHWQGLRDYRQ